MPQAIDLIVKNGALADKTFTLLSPAAGDGSIASWALKEGTISSVFPMLTARADSTGKNSRNLKVKLKCPSSYTVAATGLTMVDSAAEMNVTFSIPNNYPEAIKADFVAFALNTLNTALFKAMIRDAYSAT